MKETQILFQGWKVKKILEWDRTVYMQTRRIINPQPVKQLSQLAGACDILLDERWNVE